MTVYRINSENRKNLRGIFSFSPNIFMIFFMGRNEQAAVIDNTAKYAIIYLQAAAASWRTEI